MVNVKTSPMVKEGFAGQLVTTGLSVLVEGKVTVQLALAITVEAPRVRLAVTANVPAVEPAVLVMVTLPPCPGPSVRVWAERLLAHPLGAADAIENVAEGQLLESLFRMLRV
jgi:hypothetical protein